MLLGKANLDPKNIEVSSHQTENYIFKNEGQLDGWKDPNSTEILFLLYIPGFFSSKRLFRLNFSLLFNQNDILEFSFIDLDKAKGLPEDFKVRVHLEKLPEDQRAQDLQKYYETLSRDFDEIKEKFKTTEFKRSLFEKK